MKKKLTKKDKIFISGLITIGLIVFLFFIFVVKPMVVQLIVFDKEEKDIREKLRNAEKFAADRENLTKEIKEIEEKIAFYEERLPKEVDIPKILDRLIEIGRQTVVSFVSIEPQTIMKIKAGQKRKIYFHD
jgi:Tfp pilus assembly protein PilO